MAGQVHLLCMPLPVLYVLLWLRLLQLLLTRVRCEYPGQASACCHFGPEAMPCSSGSKEG